MARMDLDQGYNQEGLNQFKRKEMVIMLDLNQPWL